MRRRLITCAVAAVGLCLPAVATGSAARNLGTPGGDPVVTAVGDICGTTTDCAATARLVSVIDPTRVLTLGDNEQNEGTLAQFQSHYASNWGPFLAKTSPAPGNHEYLTPGASGYFAYYRSRAPAPYYSFNLGSWHIVSLNSEIAVGPGSAQEQWFRADLAAHPNACTLTYWHKPRWSSGHGRGRRCPQRT